MIIFSILAASPHFQEQYSQSLPEKKDEQRIGKCLGEKHSQQPGMDFYLIYVKLLLLSWSYRILPIELGTFHE